MKHSPRAVLEQWMQAVNQADVESLVSMYDENAVLIPTFSNRLLNTPEKIRGYFEKLGERPELSISLHEKTLVIQNLAEQQYVLGGLYNWRFSVDDEVLNFEARFSYVFDLSKEHPIVHHHSSQIPRTL